MKKVERIEKVRIIYVESCEGSNFFFKINSKK